MYGHLLRNALTTGALVLSSLALPADVAPWAHPSDHLDPSGLIIIVQPASVPAQLLDAYAAAMVVAQNHPDDYGFASIRDGKVILPAVSAAAVALSEADGKTVAEELRVQAQTRLEPAKPGSTLPVFDPGIEATSQISLVASPGATTATQLEAMNNSVFDLSADPSLASAGISSSGIDAGGRVVLTVKALTPALTATIVDKYGLKDVVILVDPSYSAHF